MARAYGQEFPERPLMSTLSDLLGIAHFTTSRGSTVRRDFLDALAEALGESPVGLDKDGVIRVSWEAAQRRTMPSDRLSPGGTVTNRVLQEIVDGILKHGVGQSPPASSAPPESEHSELMDVVAEIFDPATLGDERTRRLVEQAQREGQNTFRTAVLDAYGDRCAISESVTAMTLQAAHIAPYKGPRYNVIANGLCLRADLHILFDRGAMAIHEDTMEVLVKRHALGPEYDFLQGARLRPPHLKRNRPSVPALRGHRLWAGFDG